MKVILRLKGGKGSGHHGHSGRPGKVGGSSAGRGVSGVNTEVWYRSVRSDALDVPDLDRESGGAAGIGTYYTKTPKEASTWAPNVYEVSIQGKVLRGLADDDFIRESEKILDTDFYSELVKQGDRPPSYLIYDKFRTRFGDRRAAEIMIELGYIGVEHASPRLGFRDPNLVVFDNSAIISSKRHTNG